MCSLRSLRSYSRVKIIPMMPRTPNVVNVISMFVIVVHLQSIKQMPEDKENHGDHNTYPQGFQRKLVGNKVSNDCKPHHELAYIIAILREVVYLLFVHHMESVIEQFIYHSACNHNLLRNHGFTA